MANIQELIETAAKAAHEVNRAYCASFGDTSQVPWSDAPQWQKDSAISGVKAIAADPTLTPAQQHMLWWEQKKNDGWVFGKVKDAEKKTHPCMVPYNELPLDQRMKDNLFGTVVRAHLGIEPART